jgi:hypothetical protein
MNTDLIARWPLAGHPNDAVGANHGAAQDITWVAGPAGSVQGAAQFDGLTSAIVVPDAEALRLRNSDFTISLWLRCPAPMDGIFGDILTKFDPTTRCGLNLYVAGSAPGYNAMSDTRHIHLGIDDGYLGPWEDCGKPWPSNSLISNLLVMDAELYASIADADDPTDACRVFRWAGGQDWIDCGRLGDDPRHASVEGMIVHQGRLYAAAGMWDWLRAKGQVPGFTPAPSRVFVYKGGTQWRDLGAPHPESGRILCLASYQGDLYAGLDNVGGGHCMRLAGERWVDCGAPDGRNFENLLPLGGTLYGATHGNIYRYEGGKAWAPIGLEPYDITQIHAMNVFNGKLHIGTWPQGYVLRYDGNQTWTITGRLGIPEGLQECNEVNDLTVHNGKLYAGVIPKSHVYRFEEADGHWTLVNSLASRPGWHETEGPSWCRVPTVTSFRGKLFCGTGSCISRAHDVDSAGLLGRVYALQAGQMASYEHDIGGKWTHVAGVREGDALRLYLNGDLAAVSLTPAGHTFDLTNTQPLTIGRGPQGSLRGALSDLRLYGRALDRGEIATLAAH